jgi:hypothetical protein
MRVVLLCFAATAALSAQTMVEAGLGASRAATSTAPAAGIGKSIAGAMSTLDKTLKSADKSTSSETIVLTKDSPPPAPAKTYEPIAKAEVGLAYADLIDRFGKPAMEITGEDGIRKLSYGTTRIQVKDGKVTAIHPPAPAPPPPVQPDRPAPAPR